MFPTTTGFLLYTLGCPLIPTGSAVHAVSCDAGPRGASASVEPCYTAKEEAKRAPGVDVFAVCVDRRGLSAESDPELD